MIHSKAGMRHALLLVLSWSLLSSVTVSGIADGVVHVTDGRGLAAAVQDGTVGRIVLDSDVRFEPSDWPEEPYRLERNLTITSDLIGPHRVIDFNAKAVQNKLVIAPGTNLSFVHLTLKDTRYGAGGAVDILGASPDGIFYLHDLAKLQTSCAPVVNRQILALQREPSVPGVNDVEFPEGVVWDGRRYNGTSILYRDFSGRVGIGENFGENGYVVHKRYSYKLCSKVVDPACTAVRDAPACIEEDQDREYLTHYPPAKAAALGPAAIAGVVVAAAAAVASASAAALLLLRSLRRRRRRDLGRGGAVHEDGFDAEKGLGGKGDVGSVLIHSAWSESPPSSTTAPSSAGGRSGHASLAHAYPPSSTAPPSSSAPPSPVQFSCISELRSAAAAPPTSLPSVLDGTLNFQEASAVCLGRLLGVGSFGRVFLGSHAGRETAIKVIHHDRTSAKKVAREVELMLRFDHENVVRGHGFVTWGSSGVSNWVRSQVSDGSSAVHPVGFSIGDMVTIPFFGSGGLGGAGAGAEGPQSGPCCPGGGCGGVSAPQTVETWILQEYCDGGTLQDAALAEGNGLLYGEGRVPRVGVILRLLVGVARGMGRLHEDSVLHGDLKAANVLLASPERAAGGGWSGGDGGGDREGGDGGDCLVPKVADFGLSRVMQQGDTHLSTRTVGTLTHQAPEVIRTGRMSKAADVFSFGVLMWEVAMGQRPWQDKMMGEVMTAVVVDKRRLEFGPFVPKAVTQLAIDCMLEAPEERPTFSELLERLQQLVALQCQLQEEVDAAARGPVTGDAAGSGPPADAAAGGGAAGGGAFGTSAGLTLGASAN